MLAVAGLFQAMGVEHFIGWIPDTTTSQYRLLPYPGVEEITTQ